MFPVVIALKITVLVSFLSNLRTPRAFQAVNLMTTITTFLWLREVQ